MTNAGLTVRAAYMYLFPAARHIGRESVFYETFARLRVSTFRTMAAAYLMQA
jgi:hypothetical protein